MCKALLASQISYWPSYVGIIFIDPQILCFNIESCQPSHSSIILICPDTYGTIKKQSTTDKVDSAKFHTADQVQIENVFIGKNLSVQLLQRIFKCPSPGLMFSNVAATGKSPGIILRCKAEIVTPTPDKRYPRSQGIGKNFVHTGRYAYQKRQKTAGDQSQRPRRPTLMQI